MTLTLELSADLERRLSVAAQAQGLAPAELALQVLEARLPETDRRERAIAHLRARRQQGNAEQQRHVMEHLIQTLDEDRTSDRKLFPAELQGVSW